MLPTTRLAAGLAATLAALTLVSCSGDDEPAASDQSPEEVLAEAKTTLDETSGVQISLRTKDLPDDVTGIVEASGVGTHAPAFDGTITVLLAGQQVEVPVVAVDGTVYAQLPFTAGYSDIDPGDYGAPDPADLMSTDAGFSTLLTETTGVEAGESVRGGSDNSEILTEYTGTVPDTAVKNVIPSATGDFDASYTITDGGELRDAVLTGDFYGGKGTMTYTIGFDDYGTEQDITAP